MRRTTVVASSSLLLLGFAALAACSDSDPAPPPGAPGTLQPTTRLETDTAVEWVLEMDPATNTVRWAFPKRATPQILAAGADASVVGAAFLAKYPETFGVQSAADLVHVETEKDADGITHVRFGQKVSGAPADFARIDLHFDAQGGVSHVGGPFYPTLAQVAAQTPAIDAATATATAVQGATAFGAPAVTAGTATLVVELDEGGAPRLEYVVELTAAGEPLEARVDAMKGSYVKVLSLHQTLTASGTGVNSVRQEFEIDAPASGEPFTMMRRQQGNRPHIEVYDATSPENPTLVTSTNKDEWEQGAPADGKGSAVDSMAKLQRVEGWFREKFGYRSFDNLVAPLQVLVYLPTTKGPNAYYAGGRGAASGARYFGVYASAEGKPPTELDTMGHEFTHAVTAHNSNLEYGGQSGALNESLSDIFGQFVESDLLSGSDPSLMGEEFGPASRSMKDPTSLMPSTSHVDEINEVVAGLHQYDRYDNGGVHMLSGIPNLAWYLMTFPGNHPRGTVVPGAKLGMARSRDLYWDLMRHELHRFSSFRDAAKSTLLIARYKKIPREAIGCAWNAVGVLGADELRQNYDIDCGGDADAGTDLCVGRGTTAFCHPSLPKTAVLCVDGTFVGVDICEAEDSGEALTCTGADVIPADSEGPIRVRARCGGGTPDSCAGKEDGYYCSEIEGYEFASYSCVAGRHAEGLFCPTGKRCTRIDYTDQWEIQCE